MFPTPQGPMQCNKNLNGNPTEYETLYPHRTRQFQHILFQIVSTTASRRRTRQWRGRTHVDCHQYYFNQYHRTIWNWSYLCIGNVTYHHEHHRNHLGWRYQSDINGNAKWLWTNSYCQCTKINIKMVFNTLDNWWLFTSGQMLVVPDQIHMGYRWNLEILKNQRFNRTNRKSRWTTNSAGNPTMWSKQRTRRIRRPSCPRRL